MLDVGDGTAAVAGDDHQVELDELASLLFEERADPAPRREGLADARAAQVTHRAPDVDPQTERHVTVEGAVGLVEEEARMDEAARAALEPGRAERRDEGMGQVGVDDHARHEPAAEPVPARHDVVVDLVLRVLRSVPRLDAVLGQPHGSVEISFRYSASVNAFIVVVRTFPPAASMRMNFAAVSSLGASMTVTMSWAPIVR